MMSISNQNRLSKIERAAIRIAYHLPSWTPSLSLYDNNFSSFLPLHERIRVLTENYCIKAYHLSPLFKAVFSDF